MIITTLKELERFKSIIPSYKEIQAFDFDNAKLGKHNVTDKDFLYIFEKELMQSNLFECHEKYIDIHVPITRMETIGYIDFKNYKITQPFSKDDDVSLGRETQNKTIIKLEPGQIAIFLPGEPHQPWLADGSNGLQRKSVIKILDRKWKE
ncbi:MAG: YhcH/YjgK/YiaL family protein [Mycoplasmatales bacterium]|nr:YhcH/YjgK/YiaL family protein [Mycoplasmatales bacterium]